jgi:hypothetical protein
MTLRTIFLRAIRASFALRASTALSLALTFPPAAGCTPSVTDVPVYPLYDDVSQPVSHRETARLFGSIATVDGRDVSQLASGFELLPGSHVVQTRGEAIESTQYVTMIGQPGARLFVLAMKPGYAYIVKQRIGEEMGSRLRINVFAEELDRAGALARIIHPNAAGPDGALQANMLGGMVGSARAVAVPSPTASTGDAVQRQHQAATLAVP